MPVPLRRALVPILAVLAVVVGCSPAPSPSSTTSPPTASVVSPSPAASAAASASAAAASASSVGAASPSSAVSASPGPDASPGELTAGSGALAPGRYTKTGFMPPITLELDDGWFAGTVSDGFFDVQQDRNTPDVAAVQFARVLGVAGAGGTSVPATTAADAARTVHDNTGLVVIDESESRIGGRVGFNVTVENRGAATAPVLDVSVGRLSFDPGRRLWISFFDTSNGVLAVIVGGSVARWDHALKIAEPVLESVVIGGPAG